MRRAHPSPASHPSTLSPTTHDHCMQALTPASSSATSRYSTPSAAASSSGPRAAQAPRCNGQPARCTTMSRPVPATWGHSTPSLHMSLVSGSGREIDRACPHRLLNPLYMPSGCLCFVDRLLTTVCFVALSDDSTGKLYLKLVHYQGAYCLTTEGGVLHLTPECSMDEAQQFHLSSISAASDANDLRSVPLVSSPCSGPGCLVGCLNLPA